MIKEAAIMRVSDSKVWIGKRHCNIIHDIVLELNIHPIGLPEFIQGFITHEFVFVDRQEAWKIAVEYDQLINKSCNRGYLMSEDIY